MTTLYDQLGARPDDDEDSLKQAFRNAVKAHHPDTHPDDPEAPSRFREIVRAHTVLSDAELRTAYDRLLALGVLPSGPTPAKRGFFGDTMRKIANDAIAIAVLVVVMLGGYGLFMYVSRSSDASATANVSARPASAVAARAERPHERSAPAAASAHSGEPLDDVAAAFDRALRDALAGRAPAASAAVASAASPGSDEVAATGPARDSALRETAAVTPKEQADAAGRDAPRETPERAPAAADAVASGAAEAMAHARSDAAITPAQDPAAREAATAGGPVAVTAAAAPPEQAEAAGRAHDTPEPAPAANEATAPVTSGPTASAHDEASDAALRVAVIASEPAEIVAAAPPAQPDSAGAPAAPTESEAVGSLGATRDGAPRDAKFYREQGLIAYRAGDFQRAIADFNHAIRLDPNFEGAYIDRGIVYYRMREFARAFADMAQAKRIRQSRRAETPASMPPGARLHHARTAD